MKLHSIVCVGAMALAVAAFADGEYTDGKVVGWLRVDSDKAVTVIGIPWLCVAEDANVEVAKLVKTDNLTAGDMLYIYNNGNWTGFRLNDGCTAWEGYATTKKVNGVDTTIPAASDALRLARGQALYLERQNPAENNVAKPFYLYGRYGDLTAEESTSQIAAGGAKPTVTLLASPKLDADLDVNRSGLFTGTIDASDSIIIPTQGAFTVSYTRNAANTAWQRVTKTTMTRFGKQIEVESYTEEGCTIPRGTGFWYSRVANSALAINW